jgi:transposase
LYKERDEKQRTEFIEKSKTLDPATTHYLDETGMDNNEVYSYGWAPRGQRLYAEKPGVRTQRISIIGALNDNVLHASLAFEGYTNRDIFMTYLKKVLVPRLKPGDNVIMDNASFHKGKTVEAIIKRAGCNLIYLPTYSPDLNPIEHSWFPLKNLVRKIIETKNYSIMQAVLYAFDELGKC